MQNKMVEHQEKRLSVMSGLGMLCLFLASFVGLFFVVFLSLRAGFVPGIVAGALGVPVVIFLMLGLFMVQPNEARVLQLFGAYRGSVYSTGLRWANPFLSKRRVSVRTRNFETGKLKVNDNAGYPYDAHEEGEISLSHHTAEISERLRGEVQERLATAGVDVIEARISHLAYAAEIAAAMLQRQQAGAVVAARAQIVDGAVGMVEQALHMLSEKNVVHLDDERKAAMVSNLLAVLCSDRHTQPVVNAGTLYP